jgi:hypothetical protein
MTSHCERFNLANKKTEEIKNLNHAASSLCVTGFNKEYLFKFGGIGENRALSPFIERYHIKSNTWSMIDP